ncbi:MAG: hypothetical protein KC449_18245, partial [Anaerolineales bacterium]|nr:hypothetical protein [Anaerolineales bacterium]
PEPDELSLALDRLEQQVRSEGVTVPDTAVSPLTLSTDELNDALDWIEQQSEAPAVEEEWADDFAVQTEEPQPETAVATQQTADDDMDLTAMSEDPEAWLEQLLGDDLDMDIEMEPPPIKPSEDAVFVTDEAATDEIEPDFETVEEEAATVDSLLDDVTLDEMPDDPDAAVAWLDQMVEDDATATLETEEVGEFDLAAEHLDEMTLSDEDDPEAWLEQMLSGDLALDVDMEPPPIKPSEDAVFVTDDAPEAPSEPEPVAEPVDEMEVPETAVAEAETEEETPDLDFGDFEDDPEAWLEQMLSDDLDMAVEMEPPPIKPSEDAMFVTDDGRSHQEPEPASPLAEETDSEADIIADVPDDPDEAMVWLEQLAARQGAAIEELPSVTDADTEPEMPDWMAEELQEQAAEGVEELPISEVHDADIDAELPDWLGAESDDQVVGETDWLRALPEADMDTWLSAEEEATIAGAVEEVVLPDTGPLSPLPQTPPADETMIEDDLFEPVLEPSTGAYSVDEAKLELAQRALGDGRMNDAIVQFKELVAAGTGMMTIIAELEQAAVAHTQTPALSQVLGDAYMRNGQLQKALASYRAALDQL